MSTSGQPIDCEIVKRLRMFGLNRIGDVVPLTLPELQVPTPVRGVDSVPLIVVVLPISLRLPLVPTLPSVFDMVGVPDPPYAVES